MTETTAGTRLCAVRLILVPSLITLAVTILRLVGELNHWSPTCFNPAPGGFGAIVGIVWLVPIFGIYFALRLAAAGQEPARAGRAVGYAVLGFVILAGGFLLFQLVLKDLRGIVLMWALAALGGTLQLYGWRELGKVLAGYAYAARVPVAVVMFLATRSGWETHYTALAMPGSGLSWLTQYFLFGFIPQLVWWVGFTIVVGSVFGSIAAALARRHQLPRPAPGPS
jgi:hypothetical protein